MNWIAKGESLQFRLFSERTRENAQEIESFVAESPKHPIQSLRGGSYKYHTYNVLRVYDMVYERAYCKRTPISYLIGAYLHDIGKLQQISLFSSNRVFTPEERELSKLHTIDGFNILKEIYADPIIADMALLHHERSDGTGYPSQCVSLPEPVALLATVDPYVAILEQRLYRTNLPQEEWKKINNSLFFPFAKYTEECLTNLLELRTVG